MDKSHCQLCLSSYNESQINQFLVNTQNQIDVFQCDNCFYIGELLKFFKDIKASCGVCWEKKEMLVVYDCHHWVCNDCYINKNFLKSECLFCQKKILKTQNIKIYSNKFDYFNHLEIKDYFKKLYVQINDTVGKYVNVSVNKDSLHLLLIEYHKWLLLLKINKNNKNSNKLSPSLLIDKVWHSHILDTKSYYDVCKIINGDILHHYPQYSFLNNYFEKMERIKLTIDLYEKNFGKIDTTKEFWEIPKFDYMMGINSLGRLNIIFYNNNQTYKVPYCTNMTIKELKFIISEILSVDPDEIRLIFAGMQINNGCLKDYSILINSTLHVMLNLRAC